MTGTQSYGLQPQARMRSIAAATLPSKSYGEVLPLCRPSRRCSDRIKYFDLLLLSLADLLCVVDPSPSSVPVLTTPGVIAIGGNGKTPIPLAEKEIEPIRRI